MIYQKHICGLKALRKSSWGQNHMEHLCDSYYRHSWLQCRCSRGGWGWVIWFTSRMMNAMLLAQSRWFGRFLCALCDGHGCSYLPKNVWHRRRRKPWIGDFVLLGFGRDSKVVAAAVRAMSVTVTACGRGMPWVFVWCEISWSFHASKSFQQQTVINENQLLFNLAGRGPVLHADERLSAICVLPEWNQ